MLCKNAPITLQNSNCPGVFYQFYILCQKTINCGTTAPWRETVPRKNKAWHGWLWTVPFETWHSHGAQLLTCHSLHANATSMFALRDFLFLKKLSRLKSDRAEMRNVQKRDGSYATGDSNKNWKWTTANQKREREKNANQTKKNVNTEWEERLHQSPVRPQSSHAMGHGKPHGAAPE